MKYPLRTLVPQLLLTITGVSGLAAVDHPMLGQEAPTFDLPTLGGDRVSSAALRGQYIVLHFGAGW